ncbi:glycogenin-2-like [Limulus polyphemus]|uniref:glycogenin glucosyltransferase n=1 Tax=Limulus polyphemus TaxID=6850 RepID=A0ABM1B4F8_LIMPO|nr:glycogenin-2-like [Limulus polyphemus]XP_022241740.1 glycogenin-2-like [Limulus polyphemus]
MIPFRVNSEGEAFKISQEASHLKESGQGPESFAHFPECNCGATPEQLSQQDATPEQQSKQSATPEQQSQQNVTPEQQSQQNVTPEQQSQQNVTPEQQSQQSASPEQQSQWYFNIGSFNFSEEKIRKEISRHSTSCPRRCAMEAWIGQQGSKSSVDQYHKHHNLDYKKTTDLHNGERGHDSSSSQPVAPNFESSCSTLTNPECRLSPSHSGILSTSQSPINQEVEHPSPQGSHPYSVPSRYSTPVQVHYSPLPRDNYKNGYFPVHLQESNRHDSYGGPSEVIPNGEKSRPEDWRVYHPPDWAKSSFSTASNQPETAQNSHTPSVPYVFSYEVTDGSQRKTLPRPKSWDKMVDFVRDWLPCPPEPEKLEQAYVTIASNNLCALGCIVLGNSLRLSGTNRTLVVLITDGVSRPLRHMLATVFHIVQSIRLLGTQGTTKLALLDQPELGVSFTKLHIWRLTQFSKCVFLSPDTVVVQNCDELFERDEISAVPDIGWPDCFNSGVFVYVPAMETFCGLIEFAEQQGSFDGGDQGLLNMYFRNWALNISRKLPFIYNLMANVSYTYTPAFKQFGRNVKIVHFFGSYKPWHVKFHPQTGQMSPSANVHPTYAQFVQFWLSIFNRRVFPLLSEDIRTHAHVRKYVTSEELISFFPSPITHEDLESLPTPPSFRTYPDMTDESGSTSRPTSRKSSRDESLKNFQTSKDLPETDESGSSSRKSSRDESLKTSEAPSQNISSDESHKPMRKEPSPAEVNIDVEENLKESQESMRELNLLEETKETEEGSLLPPEEKSASETDEHAVSSEKLTSEEETTTSKKTDIPGADVGDFRGMFAWEQGRIDYLGQDSSDNILKRLDFLMKKSHS